MKQVIKQTNERATNTKFNKYRCITSVKLLEIVTKCKT